MKKILIAFLAVLALNLKSATYHCVAQGIAPQNLFVLSPAEKILFTPPYPVDPKFGGGFESFPLKFLWQAFDAGTLPVPLDPAVGVSEGWYEPNGGSSQNHSILWIGESILAHALKGNVTEYEDAAKKSMILLDSLDFVQGHMRHEGIGGYINFWQGGIACMALGGLYAPAGSTSGPALLKSARRWWADHIALLRRCRMPDGQLALIGARMNHGVAGDLDDYNAIIPAINLQLIDPQPHSTLHPKIAALISADGQPLHGTGGTHDVHWWLPRGVAVHWMVLRAFQAGAILRVPANHSTPFINRMVYKWTSGSKTHVATPAAVGLPRCRFWVSWQAGQFVRVENLDSVGTSGGKGLPNGHLPQVPFTIPSNAQHILGPVFSTPNPSCASTNSCGNDLAVISIAEPYRNGCEKSIIPKIVVKNEGTTTIINLALYYQVDNNTLYSEYNKGAIKSKRFTITGGLAPGASTTLNLDASTVAAGTHTLKVWVMDANKITDVNATNDIQTIQFEVVNAGKPTTFSKGFEAITPGTIPNDWTLYNPDAKEQWFVHSSGTNKALTLNNHAYTGAVNAKDEVVMPVIDLTAAGPIYLSFDVSHAEKPAAAAPDKLRVLISTDCGQTFTQVWKKEGAALSTVTDDANLFIPSGSQDYRNEQVDLSAYTGNNKVIIKFENTSNNGNSTLIDNVKFTTSSPTSVEENTATVTLNVFPVPASRFVTVEYELQKLQNIHMRLVNSIGQVVEENNWGVQDRGKHTAEIDVSRHSAGIYNLIILFGEDKFHSRQFVIE